jgi:CheY-like chemotaxis protein
MKIMILEDDPNRVEKFKRSLIGHNVFVTDDTKLAIQQLKKEEWDILFLDHDLGGQTFVQSGEGTGYEVATFLEKHPEYKPKTIYVHSLNPIGAQNMMRALDLPDKNYVPFAWDVLSQHEEKI